MTEPLPARTEDNACPECDEGVAVDAGPMERETGHRPLACSAGCGWSN